MLVFRDATAADSMTKTPVRVGAHKARRRGEESKHRCCGCFDSPLGLVDEVARVSSPDDTLRKCGVSWWFEACHLCLSLSHAREREKILRGAGPVHVRCCPWEIQEKSRGRQEKGNIQWHGQGDRSLRPKMAAGIGSSGPK